MIYRLKFLFDIKTKNTLAFFIKIRVTFATETFLKMNTLKEFAVLNL